MFSFYSSLHSSQPFLSSFFFFFVQEINEKGLKADEWVKSVSDLLGGKCGGKQGSAQGSGPNIDCVDKALETAKQFAQMKLGS